MADMTPALEQIKALPAKWRREADVQASTNEIERLAEFGMNDSLRACADDLDTALQSLRDEAGDAVAGVSLRFGMGALIVNTGTFGGGEPAVFVDAAPERGAVGESAPGVPACTTPLVRLLFPTKEQAQRVADALVSAARPAPAAEATPQGGAAEASMPSIRGRSGDCDSGGFRNGVEGGSIREPSDRHAGAPGHASGDASLQHPTATAPATPPSAPAVEGETRWIKQTAFFDPSQPDAATGNCTESAIASILNVRLDEVPSWRGLGGSDFWQAVDDFIESRGFEMHMMGGNYQPTGMYLASGQSERGCSHMVVMQDGRLLHDPHPSGAGLKSIEHVWLLVPKDPGNALRLSAPVPQEGVDEASEPDGYTAYGEFRWACDADERMRKEWTPLWTAALAAGALPQDMAWPKSKEVGRIGDMSTAAVLRVGLDSDNDVYVTVSDERGFGSVEFCTPGSGGGKSPRVRDALIALMVAIENDNAETPDRDWWARRLAAAPAQGVR